AIRTRFPQSAPRYRIRLNPTGLTVSSQTGPHQIGPKTSLLSPGTTPARVGAQPRNVRETGTGPPVINPVQVAGTAVPTAQATSARRMSPTATRIPAHHASRPHRAYWTRLPAC